MAPKSGMLSKDEKELIKNARLLASLQEHEGFKYYLSILDAQITARQSIIGKMVPTIEGWVAQETVKGALSAFMLARDTVSITIRTAQELCAQNEIEFLSETPENDQ